MLEELELRLDRITVNVKHSDEPLEKDFGEQATQNENDEVLDYLGNSARIDSGKYGICEVCDEPTKKSDWKRCLVSVSDLAEINFM